MGQTRCDFFSQWILGTNILCPIHPDDLGPICLPHWRPCSCPRPPDENSSSSSSDSEWRQDFRRPRKFGFVHPKINQNLVKNGHNIGQEMSVCPMFDRHTNGDPNCLKIFWILRAAVKCREHDVVSKCWRKCWNNGEEFGFGNSLAWLQQINVRCSACSAQNGQSNHDATKQVWKERSSHKINIYLYL
jgi:hypothetical protein